MEPGEIQRLKEDRMNQARKHLGYGFGPVKGTAFVAEGISAVNDNEKNHGEYQKDTTDGAGDKTAYWRLSLEEVVSRRMVVSKSMSRLAGRRACTSDCVSLRDMEANQSGD